jgi:hypothetical protein
MRTPILEDILLVAGLGATAVVVIGLGVALGLWIARLGRWEKR